MKVPALDLKRQYKKVKKEIQHNINTLCDKQQFVLGKAVADFERSIAAYCGTKYAVGCASGTDAILLSLIIAGIKRGDEVLVPSFTFIASAEPIARLGATPVFCDIDSKTYNIDHALLEKKVTKKTKAIIVVHLYGQTADMKKIIAFAKKYKLNVIEDACQAIGAVYGPLGKKAGSMGDLGCFSFFPSKNLGGFGDGGMIITDKKSYADTLYMLRQHGSQKKYYHTLLGMNSRLDALQATVLQVKLKYLDEWIKGRIEKAAYYDRLFKEKLERLIVTPKVAGDNIHTYHQYVIKINDTSKKDVMNSYSIYTRKALVRIYIIRSRVICSRVFHIWDIQRGAFP
ncbi:MAG: DegT/DnrJ/EryC1/StrS family aminotransferase [Candidatus Omnitrophota bacterium]